MGAAGATSFNASDIQIDRPLYLQPVLTSSRVYGNNNKDLVTSLNLNEDDPSLMVIDQFGARNRSGYQVLSSHVNNQETDEIEGPRLASRGN